MKSKIFFLGIIILTAVIVFSACISNTEQTRHKGGLDSRIVYVAGTLLSEEGPLIEYEMYRERASAVLWINGVPQIPETPHNMESAAFSVYVSGSDVYVAGTIGPWQYTHAALWKNGVLQHLDYGIDDPETFYGDYISAASSVYVSGGDVYVTGRLWDWGSARATLWINGIPQVLSDSKSFAESVFVTGSDIYVAGTVIGIKPESEPDEPDEYAIPTVWKNGIPQDINNIVFRNNNTFVLGSDVFTAGRTEEGQAVLMINGVPQILNKGYSTASSVFVK